MKAIKGATRRAASAPIAAWSASVVRRAGFGGLIAIRQHALAVRAMRSAAMPLSSGMRPLSHKAMYIPDIHRIGIVAASSAISHSEQRRWLQGQQGAWPLSGMTAWQIG
ncbi:hypothetical protein MKK50_13615 [Methylobacterium sp. J-043]|nr:hypothetical protein [Methylobacterium sp. J-043]